MPTGGRDGAHGRERCGTTSAMGVMAADSGRRAGSVGALVPVVSRASELSGLV